MTQDGLQRKHTFSVPSLQRKGREPGGRNRVLVSLCHLRDFLGLRD